MSKPKIGIFTKPIDDGRSGSGSHLEHILKHILSSPFSNNYDIRLIHYRKGVNPLYKHFEDIVISRNPVVASRQLSKIGFDILHYTPLTIFSPIFVNSKKVAIIHGDMQHHLQRFYSTFDVLHKRLVVRNYAKRMNHVFTVSETSKKFLVNQYHLEPSKVSVTYNAVSNVFAKKADALVERVVLDKKINGEYVFHLSKFSERKNPWTLLKAFVRLQKKHPSISLVIGGFGWDNDEVRSFLIDNDLEKHVIILGFLDQEEIVALLSGAQMFVFPSYYEGYGMPNLEAMKCECPVITSNVFAIPEIVADAALIMKDPSDDLDLYAKMELLLNDEHLKADLIARGLQNVKRFSWQESADSILKQYQKVLGE